MGIGLMDRTMVLNAVDPIALDRYIEFPTVLLFTYEMGSSLHGPNQAQGYISTLDT
jgi:hypothetical protein